MSRYSGAPRSLMPFLVMVVSSPPVAAAGSTARGRQGERRQSPPRGARLPLLSAHRSSHTFALQCVPSIAPGNWGDAQPYSKKGLTLRCRSCFRRNRPHIACRGSCLASLMLQKPAQARQCSPEGHVEVPVVLICLSGGLDALEGVNCGTVKLMCRDVKRPMPAGARTWVAPFAMRGQVFHPFTVQFLHWKSVATEEEERKTCAEQVRHAARAPTRIAFCFAARWSAGTRGSPPPPPLGSQPGAAGHVQSGSAAAAGQ